MMEEECRLREIKGEIENKRMSLNQLILRGINKDKILKCSIELDKLIVKYYDIKLGSRRADS